MPVWKRYARIVALLTVLGGFHIVNVLVRPDKNSSSQNEFVSITRGHEDGPNGKVNFQQAQQEISNRIISAATGGGGGGGGGGVASPPYPLHPVHSGGHAYPALGEYMGLEFTDEIIRLNMPEYLPGQQLQPVHGGQLLELNGTVLAGMSTDKVHSLVKKCPANNISLAVRDRPFERAITLHKDSSGNIGFQFKEGEIVAIVKDSSAARNGMVTQHQMLEINGQNVVGLKDKEVTAIVKDSGHVLTVTIMPSFVYKHMMKHMASSLTKIMDHALPLL
ncbi:PDZ domain [Trinorchestia longiramus]|nr:PDZ domain [Trinorchestia longiramus]